MYTGFNGIKAGFKCNIEVKSGIAKFRLGTRYERDERNTWRARSTGINFHEFIIIPRREFTGHVLKTEKKKKRIRRRENEKAERRKHYIADITSSRDEWQR